VIGYSLPPEDTFLRYLYALGTIGEEILRQFVVVDPDQSVAERFRNILGPGALERFRVVTERFRGSSIGSLT
jgi:hypothetical protein